METKDAILVFHAQFPRTKKYTLHEVIKPGGFSPKSLKADKKI